MKNPLYEITEKFAREESKWIDEAIKELVPMWKLNLLLKVNTTFLRKLLGVDIKIVKEELIADFGWRITVHNDITKKYIARKFVMKINE